MVLQPLSDGLIMIWGSSSRDFNASNSCDVQFGSEWAQGCSKSLKTTSTNTLIADMSPCGGILTLLFSWVPYPYLSHYPQSHKASGHPITYQGRYPIPLTLFFLWHRSIFIWLTSIINAVARHVWSCKKGDPKGLKFMAIDSIQLNIRREDLTKSLLQKETFWIFDLKMMTPGDLNEQMLFTCFIWPSVSLWL